MAQRKHKAILTIYGIDKMSTREKKELKVWLRNIIGSILHKGYAPIAKFRLMS